MRLRIFWPGKTRDAHLRALVNEYQKRLSYFTKCEIKETRGGNSGSKLGTKTESRRILDALPSGVFTVLLDPSGTELRSAEMAAQIVDWENRGRKEIAFIVGGPYGVSEELLDRVNDRWSLSRLTLTHEMARVLLLEQLYRSYTIIKGLPYQK